MSNKLDRSQDFKRAIDLGLLGRLEPNDLIKVWDASEGAERAVSALTLLTGGIDIGVPTFLTLTDTPSTYSGQGGKLVAVNVGETGLEFVDGGGTVDTGFGLKIDGDDKVRLEDDNRFGTNFVLDYSDEEDVGGYEFFNTRTSDYSFASLNYTFDENIGANFWQQLWSYVSHAWNTTAKTIQTSILFRFDAYTAQNSGASTDMVLGINKSGSAGFVNNGELSIKASIYDNPTNTPTTGGLLPFASLFITDTINNKGAVYAGDYEANFTERSLVTKQYVDGVTGGSDTNKVSYNVADSKNATERNQARVNIGSTSATAQVIATAGAIDDLAITSNNLVFSGASVVLSGIVAGIDGEEVTILNIDSSVLSILSESTLSTANNRIISAVSVPQFSVVRLKYRTTTNRWVLENVGLSDARYVRKLVEGEIKSGELIIRSATDQQTRRILTLQNLSGTNRVTVENAEINSSIRIRQPRSTFANTSCRRDELPFNYPDTVATTGTINNLSLSGEDVKLLILTAADDLTGVVPVTTDTGRELKIEGRVAGGVIIRHDSGSSTAANRFSLPSGTDLTIANGEVYTFIYTNSRWRRVQ